MKETRIRKGSIADYALRISWKIDHSAWGFVVVAIFGLMLGGIFALGMNEIHPLS